GAAHVDRQTCRHRALEAPEVLDRSRTMRACCEVTMTCRICKAPSEEILDLGLTPPANALLDKPTDLQESYPLVLELCPTCHNVQLRDCMSATELYRNYLYVTPN